MYAIRISIALFPFSHTKNPVIKTGFSSENDDLYLVTLQSPST